jgi:hypothetical protein
LLTTFPSIGVVLFAAGASLEQYGWYLFVVALTVAIFWHRIEPSFIAWQRNWGSPRNAVVADKAAVEAARARQQQITLLKSRQAAKEREAKKREAILNQKEGKKKVDLAQMKPAGFGSEDMGGSRSSYWQGGGGGGGRSEMRRQGGGGG